MKKRDFYKALAYKRAPQITLTLQTESGAFTMEISKHITRKDLPEIGMALRKYLAYEPDTDDTPYESAQQAVLIEEFLKALRDTRVTYRGSEWSLYYVFDNIVTAENKRIRRSGGTPEFPDWPGMELSSLLRLHRQKVKRADLKLIGNNPTIQSRVEATFRETAHEAADESIRKFRREKDSEPEFKVLHGGKDEVSHNGM